jgi:hypothetical protein
MSAPTFTIASDGRSITCGLCGWTSYHPEDVAHRYCGHCHIFHDDAAVVRDLMEFANPFKREPDRGESK